MQYFHKQKAGFLSCFIEKKNRSYRFNIKKLLPLNPGSIGKILLTVKGDVLHICCPTAPGQE